MQPMPAPDPVESLVHDHMAINQLLIELAKIMDQVRQGAKAEVLGAAGMLHELRELLFLHFAREEEGLFPFVTEVLPDLSWHVQSMAAAHDGICGGLSRLIHMLATDAEILSVLSVFDRFERAYGEHARAEAQLLQSIDRSASAEQRMKLADLVRGL
ncbi:MAG: hemerythrin domain-containing protein [Myxococcales bacterium]|nr:hemerythrin domain-containing protein [Myxococcales bacterium]HRC58743.1 hemerythrin domain-containing protein [Kofleriaceae bacterium]